MYLIKQVILFRSDLNMRKGKIAAQCAHASVNAVLDCLDEVPCIEWRANGHPKIVLSVSSEELLLQAQSLAIAAGIPCALITDLGHTEFRGIPTRTALAIGPYYSNAIDLITGPEGAIPTKLA